MALKRNGYPSQKALAEDLGISLSTVKNFLNGKAVDYSYFLETSQKLGFDWKTLAYFGEQGNPEHSVANPPQEQPSATEQTASSISCSVYDEETWVGREKLIRQLNQKLRGKCRILIITGVTGQGKTTLGERLATVELRDYWQQYKYLNFDDISMRDFASVADEMLTQLGEEVTADERKDAERLLNRLVQKLRNNRYLVQMDSLEVLLKGQGDNDTARNEFQDERWWEFFNRLLAGSDCQSRLILTSQDLPTQFRGSKSRSLWSEERLGGLNEVEQFELFQKLFWRDGKEVEPESEAADYLKRMGNAYEGHPLVLEVITGEILDHPFNGNVVAYWHKYRQEFEAIEAVVGHQELQLQVKDRVRKSLERLEQDVPYAYTLLLRSSVYRRPVPEPFWLEMLWSLTEEKKAAALRTLESRYLVLAEEITHTGQFLLRQHNLIRSVTYELLRKLSNQELDWRDAHDTAAKMWLTAHQPEPEAPILEQVRGYLEAFHHLCELEDWESASEILSIRLDTPTNEELVNQLGIWGYYREQIELYSRLLYKLNPSLDSICLNDLGVAYNCLGNYALALKYHSQNIALTQKIDDKAGQGMALGNLGHTYYALGDYARALDCYQQRSVSAKEIGDKAGERAALCGLGNIYHALGDYARALDYHQQCLALTKQIGDKAGQGTALVNLGNAYNFLGDYTRAIEYCQQSLTIAKQIGNKAGEALALGNLGVAYYSLGNYTCALEYCQQCLAIAKQIGDRAGQGMALGNLGNVYHALGDYARALDYHQQDLAIAKQIGNKAGEALALSNLGNAYNFLRDYPHALEYCQQSLTIAKQIGNKASEGAALGNLGNAYNFLGDYIRALEYYRQYLVIARQIDDPWEEGKALCNFGNVLLKLELYSEALENLQAALEIFKGIGNLSFEAITLNSLAELYQKLGHHQLALKFCDQALAIATELGIPEAKECQELKEKLLKEEA
ncbi:MAG: tetratricopeptide repeat protein [Cyanobacteriota bacterium]